MVVGSLFAPSSSRDVPRIIVRKEYYYDMIYEI